MTTVGSSFNPGSKFEDGYKSGLVVSVASTTTLTLSPGACLDSTKQSNVTSSSTITINSAVVGANGIDVGALEATKIYAGFLIWNSTDASVEKAGLISLSATAPALPSGYNAFRRVFWAFTDGSSLFRTMYAYGEGREVLYKYSSPVVVKSAGADTSATPVTLDQLCPAIDKIPVLLDCALNPGAAGRALTLYPSGDTGTSRDVLLGQVTSVVLQQQVWINALLISGVPKFDYKVSNAGDAATIYIGGFIDMV